MDKGFAVEILILIINSKNLNTSNIFMISMNHFVPFKSSSSFCLFTFVSLLFEDLVLAFLCDWQNSIQTQTIRNKTWKRIFETINGSVDVLTVASTSLMSLSSLMSLTSTSTSTFWVVCHSEKWASKFFLQIFVPRFRPKKNTLRPGIKKWRQTLSDCYRCRRRRRRRRRRRCCRRCCQAWDPSRGLSCCGLIWSKRLRWRGHGTTYTEVLGSHTTRWTNGSFLLLSSFTRSPENFADPQIHQRSVFLILILVQKQAWIRFLER